VLNRSAIAIRVTLLLFRLAVTIDWVLLSRALVNSSSNNILGLLAKARTIRSLCFFPCGDISPASADHCPDGGCQQTLGSLQDFSFNPPIER